MWGIRNEQRDPMDFILEDGGQVRVDGGATVPVGSPVLKVHYQQAIYTRNGIWPFPDGLSMGAFFHEEQIFIQKNPGFTAIYQIV